MGVALDTVLLDVHNAATSAIGLTAATAASGDSLSVRSFSDPGYAKLEAVFLQGATPRRFRVTSPRMHDNVTGISFQSGETPAQFLLPREVGEPLYSADTLVASMDAAASSDTVAALLAYYKDLQGIDANLLSWAQVKSRMIRLKVMEVDVTSSATIGAWSDTVITTTENQLKADYEYALLGFQSSAALLCMGIKGPSTGNLRVCAPGSTETLDISEYFIEMSERHGTPHIPVFKANDRNATFISVAANTASAAADVFAILAQLR